MKACVVAFPGSNCDKEAVFALQRVGFSVSVVFHKDSLEEKKYDLIMIPGGFSYGDYLRSGAMASRSNIMQQISSEAKRGVKVVGVCNGFQILTEAGLLDGALMRADTGLFTCKNVYLKKSSSNDLFSNLPNTIEVQIAHADGRYYNTQDGIKKLEDDGKIAFKYCDKFGNVTDGSNPNGSVLNIAGIFGGKHSNIVGLMPHPERMVDGGISDLFFGSFCF